MIFMELFYGLWLCLQSLPLSVERYER